MSAEMASRLVGGDVAWGWYLAGYAKGLDHGHSAGYRAGLTDGEFAQAARQGPAVHVPDEVDAAFEFVAAQRDARRAETVHRPLTAQEIRARAEASWAAVEDRIRGAA